MLRTVLLAALMVTAAASAIAQVKPGPANGATSESAAAAGKTARGSGSTPGSSYSGSAPSLTPSLAPIKTPDFKIIEPVQIRPPGPAGGGCSHKTTSECGVEAATCLLNNSLNGNHVVDAPATMPSIRQTADRNEKQARAAGECANELRACLQPSC